LASFGRRFEQIARQMGLDVAETFIAHERSGLSGKKEFLPEMQKELIAVISKYVAINPDDIKVNLERQDNLEVLEVKIELPDAR
jgi:cell division topological specificity factor